MSHEPLIGRVEDTAGWIALARALESERPDGVFRDPRAEVGACRSGAVASAHRQAGWYLALFINECRGECTFQQQ